MSVITDRQQRDDIDKKIQSIIRTGQSYTIVGNRSVVNPALSVLWDMKKKYEKRLLRANGAVGKTLPDFSQDGGATTRTLEDWE